MDPATLLADPTAIRLEKIVSANCSLTLVVKVTQPRPECPRCHRPSTRVHSYYTRRVADLPWHGVAVSLRLRTRRFRCCNSLCTKRVFCERLPRVVAHYARKTVRMNKALELLGLLLGGEGGARAAEQLAMVASCGQRLSDALLIYFVLVTVNRQIGDSTTIGFFTRPLFLFNVPYRFFAFSMASSYLRRNSFIRRGGNLFLPSSRALSTSALIPSRSVFIPSAH